MAETRVRNNIRELRGAMTQQALADAIGVTRQTVNAIEGGKYSPTLEMAFQIAEALGARLGDVFHWDGAKAKRGR